MLLEGRVRAPTLNGRAIMGIEYQNLHRGSSLTLSTAAVSCCRRCATSLARAARAFLAAVLAASAADDLDWRLPRAALAAPSSSESAATFAVACSAVDRRRRAEGRVVEE